MGPVFKAKNWWGGEWELWYNSRVVASQKMLNTWKSSTAEIILGEEKWEAGYEGWMAQNLFVRNAAGENIAKIVRRNWLVSDSEITIDGKHYTLRNDWWGSKYYAQDENGSEVVSLKLHWWKGGAEVITTRSPEDKMVHLLASIMFYQYTVASMYASAAA